MKLLLVHNFYQQAGGEDTVFRAERDLLQRAGHEVHTYTVSNDGLDNESRLRSARNTVWNPDAAAHLGQVVRDRRIEVVHFHNTFPRLSPSVYSAARRAGAATVQTLHNYRLMCVNALFFRDGHPCQDCLGRLPVPGVLHRCYRDSLAASATVAAAQVVHRMLGTYAREVDAFITLSDFARAKFEAAGLPASRLHLKPNFVDTALPPGAGGGHYALFVGRLSPEKGVEVLLRAWEQLGARLPLRVVGDGPLAPLVQAAARVPGVSWLGQRPHPEVLALAAEARCLIMPTLVYEGGFPMTIVEAFAMGLPVIASNIGSPANVVSHGETGRLFVPGDAADLVAQVEAFLGEDQEPYRRRARAAYEQHYTGARSLELLHDIYAAALARRHGARSDAR